MLSTYDYCKKSNTKKASSVCADKFEFQIVSKLPWGLRTCETIEL